MTRGLLEPLPESAEGDGRVVACGGERKLRGHDVVGAESGVDVHEAREALDQQAGGDQKYHGERGLGDGQCGAHAGRAPAGRAACAILFERGRDVAANHGQRGDEAEYERGDRGGRHGERQHGGVEHGTGDFGQLIGRHGEQGAGSEGCQQQPGSRAHGGERRAFDQQLPREAPLTRAERRTDGELMLASAGAHEQQVGDVGARDDEQNADTRLQEIERGARIRPSSARACRWRSR